MLYKPKLLTSPFIGLCGLNSQLTTIWNSGDVGSYAQLTYPWLTTHKGTKTNVPPTH